MALVAYSDSEGSDAEPETTPAPATGQTKRPDSTSGFQVDRGNPRKIRVALPELKPEQPADQETENGPARKKARVGGSGGNFSGFNALLPAPKRAAEKKAAVVSTRKVFSLKTGAAPGFDRDADAEMRHDQELNEGAGADEETIPAAGSSAEPAAKPDRPKTETGEVKLQGNPMMFRPLSVARTQKKKPRAAPQPTRSAQAPTAKPSEPAAPQSTAKASAPPPPKPKVSLFSLPSEDTGPQPDIASAATTYEPLVYNAENETSSAGPALAPAPDSSLAVAESYPSQTVSSSLDNIASDLNLSKSERRQLFGRNAPSSESRILEFNTDKEYAMNQVRAETELAATQHNPVRAIAPGKHTLQQLVSAANSQKDALEESFATGRRNKKEAGSKYGW
ncbi:hypothetical protein N7492_005419 [Penicillium capsulatum]|uniref:Mitotic checkpoint regulator, MAD2B-interacting-domain-containing protein n=1 Tax=Penicillium capsulatum TaxID=69766 RepID=A0A9W9LRM7_9EURO|nr:hypothetical protein N7492_005419 [Penicillium capsulatum]